MTEDELHFECTGKVDLDEHDGDFDEYLIGEWSFNNIIGKFIDKRIRFKISIQVLSSEVEIPSR